jgi:peptide/nickel transport system substrate-binding protein
MRIRTRGSLAVAGLAALAMTAAACGGSSSNAGSGGTKVSLSSGIQGLNADGTPQRGGTLNMLGVGDVDYMDYNASYYTVGYLAQRMWLRELYAYPAVPGQTTTVAPDLATGPPTVSNNGKTYTVTIKTGADWNTTPKRQVSGADVILGMKRSCNPTATHFGGLADYEAVVVGMETFCNGFAKVSPTSLKAINAYMNTHQISGVTANGETVTFNLTQPSAYFPEVLTLDSFAPAPIESEKYLPGSAASAQHMIADGPYQITSYVPAKSIKFARNPAWDPSTDTIRKAYVNAINVTETGTEPVNQEVLETNGPSGGMEFNSWPPVGAVPGLLAQMQAGTTKDVNLGLTSSSNPYLDFNTISPNNNKAMGNVKFRQALEMAINRTALIQDLGGPASNPPLTHVLPNGIDGAQDVPANYNPFPYNPAKAKAALKAAGFSNVTLNILYNADSTTEPKIFTTLQSELGAVGIHAKSLAVPSADLYVKYAYGPTTAKTGQWDIGMFGWGSDWYGNAALSWFNPLYSCAAIVPAGSNYTYWCSKTVDNLVSQALVAPTTAAASTIWAKADEDVTEAAVTFQITQSLQANYHSSFVHNFVYVPAIQNGDPTNVWLSKPSA